MWRALDEAGLAQEEDKDLGQTAPLMDPSVQDACKQSLENLEKFPIFIAGQEEMERTAKATVELKSVIQALQFLPLPRTPQKK